ncbi:MAG: caspase family protein [Spirochaetes bacterium]|nr:caspase family protein [Spirochaetota bacterium]
MKKILLLALYILFIIDTSESKIIKKVQKTADIDGKSYLVIIAIDKYLNRLPLDRCIKEAGDFKNIVYANYKFDEMIELYDKDASLNSIRETFKTLQRISNENDFILIYFNGHGYIDTATDEGYWIVYDSGINEQLKENWISSTEFINMISKIKSRHIALINESCFSKSLLTEEEKIIPKEDEEYFAKSYEKKSALALLSGKKETGAEESEMTKEIVKSLKFNKKPQIDLLIIYNDIKSKVKGSSIFLGGFKNLGHEKEGGFILSLREDPINMKEYEAKKKEAASVDEKDKKKEYEKPEKKEEVVKEKKVIVQTPPDTLKNLNITSLVFLISGSALVTVGSCMFIFDMLSVYNDVKDIIDNSDYYYTNYTKYEQRYELFIALFCSSISIAGTGVCLLAASLSLKIYTNIKKKQVSLSINVRDKLEFALCLKF